MGEVVVITSGKGGVGKTTTTASLGAALAKEGKSVAVIDADIGLRNLDVALGLEEKIVYDLVDVIEQKCRLRQALVKHGKHENLFLLAASQTRDKDDISPEKMRMLCREMRESYDYVLIDCPAGIDRGFENAVAGADRALIVTVPEAAAVRDADRIVERLAAEGIERRGLIINRMRPALAQKRAILRVEEIIESLGTALLGVVPEDDAVLIGSMCGEVVADAEKSPAGMAYRNIARRVMGEHVPLLDMRPKRKGLARLFRRKEA